MIFRHGEIAPVLGVFGALRQLLAAFASLGFVVARFDIFLLELTRVDRERIFNLGYYTWVEQQGVSVEDFDRRKDQSFWHGLTETIPVWDQLIEEFNAEVGGSNQ